MQKTLSNPLEKKPLTYFDTFSGIGGFTLGIQQAYEDYNRQINDRLRGETENISKDLPNNNSEDLQRAIPCCIGYSEIDKYAIQVYNKHFNHKNYGDITTINEKDLPDFDLLVGGFPCQSFSIAGKRGGFNDTRGTMFFEIARIVKEKQPRLLLLENVKGLLSHEQGETFKVIISTLDELGYDCQWQVLNSKNFGVPQNRERVFVVGHLRGTSRPKVFPIGGTTKQDKGIVRRQFDMSGKGYASQQDRLYSEDGVMACLPNANPDNKILLDQPRIRRLTPKECERLQGFQDDWTEGLSDTRRYKCLGNAVTVNVIKEIMLKLL